MAGTYPLAGAAHALDPTVTPIMLNEASKEQITAFAAAVARHAEHAGPVSVLFSDFQAQAGRGDPFPEIR